MSSGAAKIHFHGAKISGLPDREYENTQNPSQNVNSDSPQPTDLSSESELSSSSEKTPPFYPLPNSGHAGDSKLTSGIPPIPGGIGLPNPNSTP